MPAKASSGIPLAEIAKITGGVVLGDPTRKVFKLAPLDCPDSSAITFISEKSSTSVIKQLKEFKHAAAFVLDSVSKGLTIPDGVAVVAVANPIAAIIRCVPLFFEPHNITPGIHPSAVIDPSAKLGQNISIGAFTVIGALVEIGNDVVIHPHVVLYPAAKIGSRVIIHSHATVREDCIVEDHVVIQNGAVIGAEGFGYIPDPEVGLRSVPQIGIVRVGKNVEIGANSCIDRATLAETIIGSGTKIDNQVQIGHNTKIGSHAILCGQVGIAGSAHIADGVVLGGGVGVADHIEIAKGVRVGGHSGVTSDLTEPGDYVGFPAIAANSWRRQAVTLSQISELLPKLKSMLKSGK